MEGEANADPQNSNNTTRQEASDSTRSQSQSSSAVFVDGPDSFPSSSADSDSIPSHSTTKYDQTSQPAVNTANEQPTNGEAQSRTSSLSSTREIPTKASSSRGRAAGQEPRKCWICFLDETDDDAVDSEWRSPCACALTAHESCLLNWIASIEAPGSRSRPGIAAAPASTFGTAPVLCPQCKTEIVVSRKRSYVVDAVNAIRTMNRILALPAVALVSCATVYQGLFMHGVGTIYTVFGTREGEALLEPLYAAHHSFHAGRDYTLLDTAFLALSNWRYNIGLPIIPAVLVFSRTTMLDHVIPIVPMAFFIMGPNADQLLQLKWPPTPALAFALLPYLRGLYNAAYERLWREREKRWMKELEPQTQDDGDARNNHNAEDDRNGAAEAEAEANVMAADGDDDAMGGNAIGFQIDVGLEWLGDGDDDVAAPPQAPNRAADANGNADADAEIPQAQAILNQDLVRDVNQDDPQAQEQRQDQEPRQPDQGAQQPGPNHANANANANANAIHVNAHELAGTVVGALIFPGIAAVSGELLRLILPTPLTSFPSSTSSSFATTATTTSSSSIFSSSSPSSPSTSLFSLLTSGSGSGSTSSLWTSWLGLGIFAPVKSPGLLQQRWGRSVVGGCLFVVLKDALMLYVKWRMARMQRERRVLDYDKGKGKDKGKSKSKSKSKGESRTAGREGNRDGNGRARTASSASSASNASNGSRPRETSRTEAQE